jgi:hypothetical protein
VNDGLAIDVADERHQAFPELCLEQTRMWRSIERASLEKKPSMRLSHDPWVGVNVKVKRPMGCARQPTRGLARDMGGMVVENDLDRGVGMRSVSRYP